MTLPFIFLFIGIALFIYGLSMKGTEMQVIRLDKINGTWQLPITKKRLDKWI